MNYNATIASKSFDTILANSRKASWSFFGKKIYFYAPSFVPYDNQYFTSSRTTFPSISLSGSSCALGCKHCGGKVLETMIPATSPKKLFETCRILKNKGCKGCLISGGCLPNGSVPFEKFLDTFNRIKRELGLNIIVHTGIIDEKAAKQLKEAGIAAALIDIVGSEDTIREIYRLNASIEDYNASLRALNQSGIPFIPHVVVGLHYGKLKGETRSLEMISKYTPKALVIIAFIPIKNTVMGTITPPTSKEIAYIITEARRMLPETPLVLGCMRPLGKHRTRTDTLAIKAGINAIAFPDIAAIELAKSMRLDIKFFQKCCSQLYEDL
ncbi:MAG: radical SAM protein [Candidatus Bathyarchaeota archaeon]|nr:MAG: radical SAM protein [Candidatus Bathyarchaeota archaeon]